MARAQLVHKNPVPSNDVSILWALIIFIDLDSPPRRTNERNQTFAELHSDRLEIDGLDRLFEPVVRLNLAADHFVKRGRFAFAFFVGPAHHPHQEIAEYVEGQARGEETVQNVERVKTEYVMGQPYEIWDVSTDKDRWWVITNPTNLYSQKHFPSLDYLLIGIVKKNAIMRSTALSRGRPGRFSNRSRINPC